MKTLVCTRIQYLELPFVKTFIDWYLNKLKFSNILFLIYDKNNEETTYNELQNIAKNMNYKNNILIEKATKLNNKNSNKIFDNYIPLIKKYNWCLNIDLDEYLIIPNKINIFINDFSKSIDGIFFPRIDIYNLENHDNLYDIIDSNNTSFDIFYYGKSLFKTDDIKEFGCHEFKVNKKYKNIFKTDKYFISYIAHFASRGLLDVCIKSIEQNIPKNLTFNSKKKTDFFINEYKNIELKEKFTSCPNRLLTTNIIQVYNKTINKNKQEYYKKKLLNNFIDYKNTKFNFVYYQTYKLNFEYLYKLNNYFCERNIKNIQEIISKILLLKIKYIIDDGTNPNKTISHYEILSLIYGWRL
jgi:hypothetical protein